MNTIRNRWKSAVSTTKALATAVDQIVTALVRASATMSPLLVLALAVLAPEALTALLANLILPALIVSLPILAVATGLVVMERRRNTRKATR